jgi:hypothetical protein
MLHCIPVQESVQCNQPLPSSTHTTAAPAATACLLQLGSGSQAQPEQAQSDEADLVLSEVHLECRRPGVAGSPSCTVFTGRDGAEVARICHLLATPLSRVGLQVWRGSLLLADYVLSQAAAPALRGCTALELGCGPGLAGLALARLARAVYLTGATPGAACLLWGGTGTRSSSCLC